MLHKHFVLLVNAVERSAIYQGLGLDGLAHTFYLDPEASTQGMDQLFNVLITLFGAVASALGPLAFAKPAAAAGQAAAVHAVAGGLVGGSAPTMFTGTILAVKFAASSDPNSTPLKAAELGLWLKETLKGLANATRELNNKLMEGQDYEGKGDVRSYIANGAFLWSGLGAAAPNERPCDPAEVSTPDRTTYATELVDTIMTASSINHLWRQQKVFIVGGAACDDTQIRLGKGPANESFCDEDNRMWYLYYWYEHREMIRVPVWKEKGDMEAPPGRDSLGSESPLFGNISHVINGSLISYRASNGSNNYTAEIQRQNLYDKISTGNGLNLDPTLEGTFSLPVCNISAVVDVPDFPKKDVILQPYGHDYRLQFCGAVCTDFVSGQLDYPTTKRFIEAANMKNFESLTYACPRFYGIDDASLADSFRDS
ncbi:MAG: hypothetical protein M1833_006816 [Piccolia ochrophora]|nr:MAG: hypothetical protein M1833_006816 [Piccolia ochrophora]